MIYKFIVSGVVGLAIVLVAAIAVPGYVKNNKDVPANPASQNNPAPQNNNQAAVPANPANPAQPNQGEGPAVPAEPAVPAGPRGRATPTPVPTATIIPKPSPTITPSPTPVPTPSPSPTPVVTASPSPTPISFIFYDYFDRASSTSVGNGWSEAEQMSTDLQILNNHLRMSKTTTTGGSQSIIKSHGQLPSAYTVRTKMTAKVPSVFRAERFMVETQGGLYGLGFGFYSGTNQSGNISLSRSGHQYGWETLSSPADLTGTFYLWMDVIPNGSSVDVKLYHSKTGSKPSLPILSATNASRGPGLDALLLSDWTTSGDYVDVDYFVIEGQ